MGPILFFPVRLKITCYITRPSPKMSFGKRLYALTISKSSHPASSLPLVGEKTYHVQEEARLWGRVRFVYNICWCVILFGVFCYRICLYECVILKPQGCINLVHLFFLIIYGINSYILSHIVRLISVT